MDTFVFYGKLASIKKTEKFSPITHNLYDSGWETMQVKFNVQSNGNRILCSMNGGRWADCNKNIIRTFTANKTDENGKTVKGTMIEIPWSDRFDEKYMSQVPDYRKWIIDLGDYSIRKSLQNIVDGKATDTDMEIANVSSVDEAKSALEKSNKRRHVYLDAYDACEFMQKVLASDKIKDTIFRVSGVVEKQYNAEKEQFYTNYAVNKIEIPSEDKGFAQMSVDFYFTNGCVDDSDFNETGKAYISGFTRYYDGRAKENGFAPITIVVRDDKQLTGAKAKLKGEDEVMNIGVIVDVIDGTEMNAITYDDLSDEDKFDIDCGLLDLDEVIKNVGDKKAGDKIKEIRLNRYNPRKRTVESTAYSVDDLHPAIANVEEDEDEDDDIL